MSPQCPVKCPVNRRSRDQGGRNQWSRRRSRHRHQRRSQCRHRGGRPDHSQSRRHRHRNPGRSPDHCRRQNRSQNQNQYRSPNPTRSRCRKHLQVERQSRPSAGPTLRLSKAASSGTARASSSRCDARDGCMRSGPRNTCRRGSCDAEAAADTTRRGSDELALCVPKPRPRHATRRYSLIRPPTRAWCRTRCSPGLTGSRSGFSGAAACRER